MPRIHPKTWADGVMPLSEFPPEKQAAIAEAVSKPHPPPRWLHLGLARIQSRAWYEWHWERGRKLVYVAGESRARKQIPDELRLYVYERDGFRCLTCGSRESLTLDHIHPFSLGGPDTVDNLQTLCRPCNSRKGARV
jgi:hypothetical protein